MDQPATWTLPVLTAHGFLGELEASFNTIVSGQAITTATRAPITTARSAHAAMSHPLQQRKPAKPHRPGPSNAFSTTRATTSRHVQQCPPRPAYRTTGAHPPALPDGHLFLSLAPEAALAIASCAAASLASPWLIAAMETVA